MYSTCLFCNQDLGRNEAVEHFPIGRRLAYDAAKGRLWVVCRRCERWNLTPLEERWEAIEECERLFRSTRLRVATDNVGLGKVADGTELVRIGAPLRPEFAAWRYGDQFGRRRMRQLGVAGVGVAALGALAIGGAVAGVGIGSFAWIFGRAATAIWKGNPGAQVATVRAERAIPLRVLRGHLAESRIELDAFEGITLDLRHAEGRQRFTGREAERVTALLMPHVNRFGGSRQAVASAVAEIEAEGGSPGYLERIARVAAVTTRFPAGKKLPKKWSWGTDVPKAGLFALHEPQRLALEMALHEESERRAMAGDLAELETAWRQAEEIAAIADDLLLPASVDDALRRTKGVS